MPRLLPFQLEPDDILGNSPAVRGQLKRAEEQAAAFGGCVDRVCKVMARYRKAQQECADSLASVAQELMTSEAMPEPDSDNDVPTRLFLSIGQRILGMSEWHRSLVEVMKTEVEAPLTALLKENVSKMRESKEAFIQLDRDHHDAMIKYSKVSKKKETEKVKFEANAELFNIRKHWYEASLSYATQIGTVASKRRFALLEPLLAWMNGEVKFFNCGHETLCNSETKSLLASGVEHASASHSAHRALQRQSDAENTHVQQASTYLFYPDPDPNDPFLDIQIKPACTTLLEKTGYLFCRFGKVRPKWGRAYFSIEQGQLKMLSSTGAKSVMLALSGSISSLIEKDDRRFVFQATSGNRKRRIFLQAENSRSCEEWIATLNNVARRVCSTLGNSDSPSVYYQPGVSDDVDHTEGEDGKWTKDSSGNVHLSLTEEISTPREKFTTQEKKGHIVAGQWSGEGLPPPPPKRTTIILSQKNNTPKGPRANPFHNHEGQDLDTKVDHGDSDTGVVDDHNAASKDAGDPDSISFTSVHTSEVDASEEERMFDDDIDSITFTLDDTDFDIDDAEELEPDSPFVVVPE